MRLDFEAPQFRIFTGVRRSALRRDLTETARVGGKEIKPDPVRRQML